MRDRQTLLLQEVMEITFWNSNSEQCLRKIKTVPVLLLGANFPRSSMVSWLHCVIKGAKGVEVLLFLLNHLKILAQICMLLNVLFT